MQSYAIVQVPAKGTKLISLKIVNLVVPFERHFRMVKAIFWSVFTAVVVIVADVGVAQAHDDVANVTKTHNLTERAGKSTKRIKVLLDRVLLKYF